MSYLERLPAEIVLHIAEMTTWDPSDEVFVTKYKGAKNQELHLYRPIPRPPHSASYARAHASLARTNKNFYKILNYRLYRRNLTEDPVNISCLRWAIHNNRLETLRRAQQYGADFTSYGALIKPDALENNPRKNFGNDDVVPQRYSDTACRGRSGTPLFHAIFNGFSDIVAFLLEAGVDVNAPGPADIECKSRCDLGDKATPLHFALQHGRAEYASVLVQHGAYLSLEGSSAIVDAYSTGRTEIVETLLQRTDLVSTIGKLHYAAMTNNLDLLQQALEHPGVDINTECVGLGTPLCLAVLSENEGLDVVEFLLQQPGIHCPFSGDFFVQTPFSLAASKGRLDIIRLLMAMPGFDYREYSIQPLFTLMAESCSEELFEFFLQQPGTHPPHDSARLRRVNWGMVLRRACASRNDDRARSFVEYVMNLGVHAVPTDITLTRAILSGNVRTALFLLPHVSKANQELRGYGTQKPAGVLHYALMEPLNDQLALVKAIIEDGAKVNEIVNHDCFYGRMLSFEATPLFFALTFARSRHMMELLFEAGAEVGRTVLLPTQFHGFSDTSLKVSMLAAFFLYLWKDKNYEPGINIGHPLKPSLRWDPATEDDMFEIEDRILLLLEHGAAIDSVAQHVKLPSALRLVCIHAQKSLSMDFLNLLTKNATRSNVSVGHVETQIEHFSRPPGNAINQDICLVLQDFKRKLITEEHEAQK